MAGIGARDTDSTQVYNAAVSGTKLEVTDNPNVLVYSFHILNTTAAAAFLQVFDKDADNVTVGTTVADYVIAVAASGTREITYCKPIRHTVGLTVTSTTTRGGSTGASQEVTITYNSAK